MDDLETQAQVTPEPEAAKEAAVEEHSAPVDAAHEEVPQDEPTSVDAAHDELAPEHTTAVEDAHEEAPQTEPSQGEAAAEESALAEAPQEHATPEETAAAEPLEEQIASEEPAREETAEEAESQERHPQQTVSIEEWIASSQPAAEESVEPAKLEDVQLLAVLEACVYVAEEPLMPTQIAAALNQEPDRIRALMQQLMTEFDKPEHGVSIKEVAGGYKMATKAEHHEAVRNFVKSLKAPLKLSLPALETLAVVAYKQPVTSPEIMEIRGVQGGGVLKTLLDRKLITEAGRKNVIGKPILYKTTKEFLIQFGLKDLGELPTLKEFEEIRRMAMSDAPETEAAAPETPAAESQAEVAVEASASESEAPPQEAEAAAPEVPAEQPTAAAETPETEAPPPADTQAESQDQ